MGSLECHNILSDLQTYSYLVLQRHLENVACQNIVNMVINACRKKREHLLYFVKEFAQVSNSKSIPHCGFHYRCVAERKQNLMVLGRRCEI